MGGDVWWGPGLGQIFPRPSQLLGLGTGGSPLILGEVWKGACLGVYWGPGFRDLRWGKKWQSCLA